MRARWIGVVLVVIVAIGIIAYKQERSDKPAIQTTQRATPSNVEIILVADLREANEEGDNCAEIIHLVRDTSMRGAKVQELTPDSDSPLLKRYRVLTNPTVLILDSDGTVVSRYEGESSSTVQKIRDRLATLSEAAR